MSRICEGAFVLCLRVLWLTMLLRSVRAKS